MTSIYLFLEDFICVWNMDGTVILTKWGMLHVSWCSRGEMHDYDEKQKRNLAGNADWARDACSALCRLVKMENCQHKTVPLDLKCLCELTWGGWEHEWLMVLPLPLTVLLGAVYTTPFLTKIGKLFMHFVHLHSNAILGAWKLKRLKTISKVFESDTVMISV